MTRQHSSSYKTPTDPHSGDRRPCGHLVYADETPADPCRWASDGCKGAQDRPEAKASGDAK